MKLFSTFFFTLFISIMYNTYIGSISRLPICPLTPDISPAISIEDFYKLATFDKQELKNAFEGRGEEHEREPYLPYYAKLLVLLDCQSLDAEKFYKTIYHIEKISPQYAQDLTGYLILNNPEKFPSLISVLYFHNSPTVSALAYQPPANLIASGDRNGVVKLWDIATQNLIHELIAGKSSFIRALAFHPQRNLLAIGLARNKPVLTTKDDLPRKKLYQNLRS